MPDPAIIRRYFGTSRGLIRLGLSYGQYFAPNARQKPARAENIKRLVFVCHGNICRSAFAEAVARDLGLSTVSLGLSTTSGKGAHPPVMDYAASVDLPLDGHVTTAVEDFVPQAGDLLLAMEFRHLGRLSQNPALAEYPRDLLGLFHSPPILHLHDPYKLDEAYLPISLERVRRAVHELEASFPGAKIG